MIEGAHILTLDRNNTEIPDGYVLIKGDRVAEVGAGRWTGSREKVRVIQGRERLLMPGLVNAHTHSYANLVKGTTENLPLEPWMPYATASGVHMTPDDVYLTAMLGCIEMIRTGTTCFLDHIAQDLPRIGQAVQAYREAGLRAVIAPMISDKKSYEALPYELAPIPADTRAAVDARPVRSTAEAIALNEEAISKWNGCGGHIHVVVAPSGPQRSTDDLLVRCKDLAERYDVGFHTHMLESKAQYLTASQFYGKSMVEHLDELGLVSHRTSFAHSVWITPGDIEILAGRGGSIVHNASSNLILASGLSPAVEAFRAGVNIAIGTDGPNCGANQSMFESMKLAAMLHKCLPTPPSAWPTAREVLKMATVGGVRAILWNESIGSIEPGHKADVILLNRNTPYLAPLNDAPRQLVYTENGSSVRTVVVNGCVIMEEGVIKTFDEAAIIREATLAAGRLLERMQADSAFTEQQSRYGETLYAKSAGKDIGFTRLLADTKATWKR